MARRVRLLRRRSRRASESGARRNCWAIGRHVSSARTGRIAPAATRLQRAPTNATSAGPTRLPTSSPKPKRPSITPNIATRSSFRTPRWTSVNPETSRTALLTPVANSATTARAATGQAPMRIKGRPHAASAIEKTLVSPGPPVRPRAPRAPIRPPNPIAAFSRPIPLSPIERSSIAETTMSVTSRPRTNVCATKSPATSVAPG